jgi:opacity protein-like surface antigen
MTSVGLKRVLIVVLHVAVIALCGSVEARAQGFISPMIGFDFGDDSQCPEVDDCEDKNLNVSFGLGVMGDIFGFEEEFSYAQDFFGSAPGFENSVLTLMSNVMLVPNLGPFRPYALIGAGLIKTNVEFTPGSILNIDNNHFGWDVGGGLIILFGDHFGIRGDLRYFHSFRDLEVLDFDLGGTKLDFGRASGGFVFKF